MMNFPNLLSLTRIAMLPVLVGLAVAGHKAAFLGALAFSLSTDIADGYAARRLGQCTPLGTKLDSWGDLLTWITLLPCAWLLWPAELAAQWPFLAVAVASFTLPIGLGLLKFGTLTRYHTWGAKLSAVAMGPAIVVLLGFGLALPFHVATAILALSAIEEMLITLRLHQPAENVKSLWHVALAERQGEPA